MANSKFTSNIDFDSINAAVNSIPDAVCLGYAYNLLKRYANYVEDYAGGEDFVAIKNELKALKLRADTEKKARNAAKMLNQA